MHGSRGRHAGASRAAQEAAAQSQVSPRQGWHQLLRPAPVHLVEARRAKRGGRAELEAGLAAFCTTRSQLQAGSPNFHLRRQQRPVDGRGASWPAATTAHRAPTPQKKPPRAQAEPKPRKRAAVRVRPFGALWGGWWLSSAECGPLATPFGSSFSLVEEVGLCTVNRNRTGGRTTLPASGG